MIKGEDYYTNITILICNMHLITEPQKKKKKKERIEFPGEIVIYKIRVGDILTPLFK